MRTICVDSANDPKLQDKKLLDVAAETALVCNYHQPPFDIIIRPFPVPEYHNQRFLSGALRCKGEISDRDAEVLRGEAQRVHDQLFQTSHWSFADQPIEYARAGDIHTLGMCKNRSSPSLDAYGAAKFKPLAPESTSAFSENQPRRSARLIKPKRETSQPLPKPPLNTKQPLNPKQPDTKQPSNTKQTPNPSPRPERRPQKTAFEKIACELRDSVVFGVQCLQATPNALLWGTGLEELRARPATTLEGLLQKLEDYGQGNRVHSFLTAYATGNAEILRVILQRKGRKKGRKEGTPKQTINDDGRKNMNGMPRWRRQQQSWLSGVVNGLIRLEQPSATVPLMQIIPRVIALSNRIDPTVFRKWNERKVEEVAAYTSILIKRLRLDWDKLSADGSFDPIELCCVGELKYEFVREKLRLPKPPPNLKPPPVSKSPPTSKPQPTLVPPPVDSAIDTRGDSVTMDDTTETATFASPSVDSAIDDSWDNFTADPTRQAAITLAELRGHTIIDIEMTMHHETAPDDELLSSMFDFEKFSRQLGRLEWEDDEP